MLVETFEVGDRVIAISGWRGTVVKVLSRNNGYRIEWDADSRARNQFAPATSDVVPLNLRRENS